MEKIKAKIGTVGLAVAAMGILSIVLSFFDYNFKLLAWIDLWGSTTGWIIRIALILVGGALFFFLGTTDDDED